jgi:putative ABC transport system permease protein
VTRAWRRFVARVARLGWQARRGDDVGREIADHLDLEAAEQQDAGLSPEDARFAARRAFGSTALVAEDVRAVWTARWLDALVRDSRYAVRVLRRNAGFTLVSVLTLALGIGATSAIFTVADALMLRPLPFPRADELVRLYVTRNGVVAPVGPSAVDAHDYALASRTLARLVTYDAWRRNVGFDDARREPEEQRVGLVPAEYFEILGIRPLLGRLFTDDENQEGRNHVAAIGAALWQTRFAGDPRVLGRTLSINDEPYTIVAVMPDVVPEWMEAGRAGRIQVWTPPDRMRWWAEDARGSRGFTVLARLRPGVSVAQAQADLSAVAARLAAEHPIDRGIGVAVRRLADTRVGALGPMLWLLVGAVGLILLIACVNVANLLLARNAARQRELAVRAALGAGRGGLVRQLLAETLLLSLAGAGIGLLFARAVLAALALARPPSLPQLGGLAVDGRVLAFTLAVSMATSLLFGLAPALTAARSDLVDALRQGGRGGSGARGRTTRNALVAAETAMSLMLLVGASLVAQSLLRLQHQPLGIRQDHLLKGHFYLPPVRYPDPDAITRLCDAFAASVRRLPGVIDATISTAYPPDNGWTQMIGIASHPLTRVEDVPTAQFGVADAHFLSTLGLPLLRGRNFEESDAASGAAVAIVSAGFVRRFFPGQDPIGQRVHVGPPPFLQLPPGTGTTDNADVTIVGVAGDFRNAGLALRPEPHLTVLYAQHPLVNYGFKDILVRTASDPHGVAVAVGRELRRIDSSLPFAEVQTIDELVEQQTGGQRLTTAMLGAFAGAGLLLAVVGIYGVVSFLVSQRTRELAVRMAIGAGPGAVVWLVLRESLLMAALGSAIGLGGAAAARRLTAGVLFGVSPIDPLTFAGAAAFLMAAAATASLIPGRRATRVDPARTLCGD